MAGNAPHTKPRASGSMNSPRRLRNGWILYRLPTRSRNCYDEVRGNFDSFIAARPDETPFCYWWGPTNTHRTWERGSGKELWGLDPDDLKGRMPAFLPDVHEIREDFNDYLGENSRLRCGTGRDYRALGGNRGTGQYPDCGKRRPRHPRISAWQVQPVQLRHGSGYGGSLAWAGVAGPRRQRLREPDGLGAYLPGRCRRGLSRRHDGKQPHAAAGIRGEWAHRGRAGLRRYRAGKAHARQRRIASISSKGDTHRRLPLHPQLRA